MSDKKAAILEELKATPNATTPDIRQRLHRRGVEVSDTYIYSLRTTPADYKANLAGAVLSSVDLTGANLAGATLPTQSATVSLDELANLNRIVQSLGSDDTRRLIAAVS